MSIGKKPCLPDASVTPSPSNYEVIRSRGCVPLDFKGPSTGRRKDDISTSDVVLVIGWITTTGKVRRIVTSEDGVFKLYISFDRRGERGSNCGNNDKS